MHKIKVWGGTHPNEKLGMAVADSLMADPIPNVDAGIVNKRARLFGNLRLLELNMNAAYPGDPESKQYEYMRAPEVLAESQGYFAVVDFHANNYEGEDTACIGTRGVSPEVLGFLAGVGLKRLVYTEHNTLHEHVDNGFLLEIVKGGERDSVDYWRERFDDFANAAELPVASVGDFEWFQDAGNVHFDQATPAMLTGNEEPFGQVPVAIQEAIEPAGRPLYWLDWDKWATENYWAEVCTPMPAPDDTTWPKAEVPHAG